MAANDHLLRSMMVGQLENQVNNQLAVVRNATIPNPTSVNNLLTQSADPFKDVIKETIKFPDIDQHLLPTITEEEQNERMGLSQALIGISSNNIEVNYYLASGKERLVPYNFIFINNELTKYEKDPKN